MSRYGSPHPHYRHTLSESDRGAVCSDTNFPESVTKAVERERQDKDCHWCRGTKSIFLGHDCIHRGHCEGCWYESVDGRCIAPHRRMDCPICEGAGRKPTGEV